MVRFFDNHPQSHLEESELVDDIFKSDDPLINLEKELKQKSSRLWDLTASKPLQKLSDYILGGIIRLADELESECRQGKSTSGIEKSLLRLLKVHREMNKNSAYLKLGSETAKDIYFRLLTWSSQMVLSEEILGIITEFSFDKSMKLYYYYFKYYMSHLNLFYQNQIKIKHLFLATSCLDFAFCHQGNQYEVHIDKLNDYISNNSLHNCYSVAQSINKSYQLNLSQDDHIFHALMIKIRIIMEKNRNIVVRTVINANWIFCYIDIAWMKSGEKFNSIPQIFSLPPDYYALCEEIISLFFMKQADSITHGIILKLIENISDLENRVGLRQFSVGLAQNSSIVLKLLNQINNQLDISNQNENLIFTPCRQAMKDNETMAKLFKILLAQIAQSVVFHNTVEQIAEKIFTRTSKIKYNETVQQLSGQILLTLEIEDQIILQHSMKCIHDDPDNSSPHIKTLATLLQTNYMRQRRDSGASARKIAQSDIFDVVLPRVQEQLKKQILQKKSIIVSLMSLISNICSQNPTLVVLLSEQAVLEQILKYLSKVQKFQNPENIVLVLQYFHNICLREGEFRKRILDNYLDRFICRIFSSNIQILSLSNKQLGSLWSNINRLSLNIHQSNVYVFGGLILALRQFNKEYQKIPQIEIEIKCFQKVRDSTKASMNKLINMDRKVFILCKIIEKCMPHFIKTIPSVAIVIMYSQIINIAVMFDNSFLNAPYDVKSIITNAAEISQQHSQHLLLLLSMDRDPKSSQKLKHQGITVISNTHENSESINLLKKPPKKKSIILKNSSALDKHSQYLKDIIFSQEFYVFSDIFAQNHLKYYTKLLKQCLGNYSYQRPVRKLSDILFQEQQFTEQIYSQAKIAIGSSYLSKVLTHLYKEIQLSHYEKDQFFEQIIEAQTLLMSLQKVVELDHIEILGENLKIMKGITTQAKLLPSRASSLKIISEDLVGKQLHNKLQQGKSFHNYLIDILMKFIPNVHLNDQQKALKLVNNVIEPYVTNFYTNLNSILNSELPLLQRYQRCRYGMKILLEIFCYFTNSDKDKKKIVYQFHIKQIIMKKQQLFGLIFKVIEKIWIFLTMEDKDMVTPLEDKVQNRIEVSLRIMTKMIINRIFAFITHFEIQITPKTNKTQEDKILNARYIQKYIHTYTDFIINLKNNINPKNYFKTDELFEIIHEKIKNLMKIQTTTEQQNSSVLSKNARKKIQEIQQKTEVDLAKLEKYLFDKMVFPKYILDYIFEFTGRKFNDLKNRFHKKEQAQKLFNELNLQMISICQLIFKNYKLTFSMHKKKLEQIKKVQVNHSSVNVSEQIRKLGIIMKILYRYVLQLTREKQFSKTSISSSYVGELLNFIKEIVSNHQLADQQDQYGKQANTLIYNTNLFLREYINYLTDKTQAQQDAKRNKRKLKRETKKKKNQLKSQKIQSKKSEKQEGNNKRIKQSNKNAQIMNQLEGNLNRRIMRKDKSKVNLILYNQNSKEPTKNKNKKNRSKRLKKSFTALSTIITQYLKATLSASENKPFLKNITLQGITLMINTLMTYEDLNFEQKKNRRQIQIDALQLLPVLLRARICEVKHQGFFHLLSEMGVQLIDNQQIMIDLEIGIKRLFFEAKKLEIPYKDFKKKINQLTQLDVDSLGYFLYLKYKEKNGQFRQVPLSQKFIEANKNKVALYVCLKQNSSLNTVSYRPEFRKKKSVVYHNSNDKPDEEILDNQIKTVDNIPSKPLCDYIQYIIQHVVRLIVRGICQMQHQSNHKMEEQLNQENAKKKDVKVDVFNIVVLLQSLQVLMRWSPSLTPYITKFKTRKLIADIFSELHPNKAAKSFIFQLLNLDDKKQITFLVLLIRGISPMLYNRVFTIIFEMCLDNTVLQKQKHISQNEQQKNDQEPSYVTFGKIVRYRTIVQIDEQLKRTKSLVKKMLLMNLFTSLISIRQFAWQCMQNHSFIQQLHENFINVLNQLKSMKIQKLSFASKVMVIPFFLTPISLIHELIIAFHVQRKRKSQRKLELGLLLTKNKIDFQIVGGDSFRSDKKFKQNWPYLGIIDEAAFMEETIGSNSFMSDSELQSESMDQFLENLPPPGIQLNDMSESENNSHNYQASSWVNNEISNNPLNDFPLQDDESGSNQIALNIYPLPEESDNILSEMIGSNQEEQSMRDEQISSNQMEQSQVISGSSNMNEGENDQYPSQIDIQSDQEDFLRFGRSLFNPRSINMYDDFDNVIGSDKTDENNSIFRLEKEQEIILKQLLLCMAGNKDEKVEKMQIFKQILKNEKQFIQYSEYIEFTNFSKFQAYYWETPTIFKVLKNQEQIIFSSMRPFHEFRDLVGFDIAHNIRNRRGGFIISNTHESLLNLQRQANNMNQNQIAGQILRRNNPLILRNIHDMPNSSSESVSQSQSVQRPQMIGNELQFGEDAFSIPNEQLEEQLAKQNFSMEQYRNLPYQIRNDIINNILEQRFARNYENQIMEQFSPVRSVFQIGDNNQERLHEIGNVSPQMSIEENNQRIRQQMEQEIRQQQNQEAGQQIEEEINQSGVQSGIQIGSSSQSSLLSVDDEQNNKKICIEHTRKINRDLLLFLNKDKKNDQKFIECTDEFLFSIIDLLLYILNQSDYVSFPYNLIPSLCINSKNQTKILSTLMGILFIGPTYNKNNPDKLPKTKIISDNKQLQQNYQVLVYPVISLKILYLFYNLSKQFSLAISMLKNQSCPIHHLDIESVDMTDYKKDIMMESLISLVQFPEIGKENTNMEQLVKIINNLTLINYNSHIYRIVDKKNAELVLENERAKNQPIQLNQKCNQLLCGLLQNDHFRDNQHLFTSIIMRLSITQTNLTHFIKYFRNLLKGEAENTLKQLKEAFEKHKNQQKSLSQKGNYKQKLLKNSSGQSKISHLMEIFSTLIQSLNMSTLSSQEQKTMVSKLKQILLCNQIKQLCQTGCEIIVADLNAPPLIAKIHQFIDCFFAVYHILSVKDHSEKALNNEKIQIADLGKISEAVKIQKKHTTKRKFVSDFIDINYLWEKKMCTPQGKAFINANIKNKLTTLMKAGKRGNESLLDLSIISAALETPHMLEFENKKLLFKAQNKRVKHKKHFNNIYLSVKREQVFQRSFTEIISKRPDQLKGKLKVEFQDEQGEDAGGLTRQWFQLLSKQMFNPNYALFMPSSTGNTYQPSSKSYINQDHLNYFKFIGRIMGKALYDGFLLDAYFTPAFYKHILSLPISYEDMQEEDYQFFNSLKWILNNAPIEEYMQLFFTYQFDNFGQMETRTLCEGGQKRLVTEENKIEYVELISYAKMATAVQKQIQKFLEGFHDLIPKKLIKIFDEKQLEIMISGLPTIDIVDLKKNTNLVNYNKTDSVIIWLFEVLESFDMGLRTAFLQFVTGTSRVPSQGFKGLQGFNGLQKFNIHKDFQTNHLPRAHTCFNQLDLPAYQSKQLLIQKLTLAITEGREGFGII